MRRRNFIVLAAGTVILQPVRALAQIVTRRPLVAILTSRVLDKVMLRNIDTFAQDMQEIGLVAGQDYDVVLRSTEADTTRATKLRTELISLNPAVILTQDTPLTLAARRVTNKIPIIGVFIADPVGFSLVASLARPGATSPDCFPA